MTVTKIKERSKEASAIRRWLKNLARRIWRAAPMSREPAVNDPRRMAEPASREKTLRAREIILEDHQGRERAALRHDENGNVVFTLAGSDGAPRLSLSAAANGMPRIHLSYAEGKGSIELEANDRLNSAGMIIVGAEGNVQALMGVTGDGMPALALFDACGNPLTAHRNIEKPPAAKTRPIQWDRLSN